MRTIIVSALVTVAFLGSAMAAEHHIELDPGQSLVAFTLGATLHTVHGSAAVVSGAMGIDDNSRRMTGKVTVDATSAKTGNTKRDKKMHAKVLLTSDHPQIVLRPHRLEGELQGVGASQVIVHGVIEILGQPHEIALPLQIEIEGGRFAAFGQFDVPYVEWGLKNPSNLVLRVAKVVQVTVEAAGTVVAAE